MTGMVGRVRSRAETFGDDGDWFFFPPSTKIQESSYIQEAESGVSMNENSEVDPQASTSTQESA